MLLEKEILIWKDGFGLTTDLDSVKELSNIDFPKLIFQDCLNQLKISKIPLGFELNTSRLFEVEPNNKEQLDDTVRFKLIKSNILNFKDILSYYLLTLLLHTDFNTSDIYSNNHYKSELFFKSQIPFSNKDGFKTSDFIKYIESVTKPKELTQTIERFFILMGKQYQDKLMLFLTYLETKYNFKMNKSNFIDSVLGQKNLNKVKNHINKSLITNA